MIAGSRSPTTASRPGRASSRPTNIASGDEKPLDMANRLRKTIGGVSEMMECQQEPNKNLGEPLFEKQMQTP